MSKLHVVAVANVEEGTILVENESGKQFLTEANEFGIWVANGLEATYEENEEVIDLLKHTTMEYASVDTYTDGSGEFDLYIHKAKLDGGVIVMDKSGEFVKTYKTESGATKAAHKLCSIVNVY